MRWSRQNLLYVYRLQECFEKANFDVLFRFERTPTRLGRLLRRKPLTFQVVGYSTVWHYYPSGVRVPTIGTISETSLSELHTAYEWEKEENRKKYGGRR